MIFLLNSTSNCNILRWINYLARLARKSLSGRIFKDVPPHKNPQHLNKNRRLTKKSSMESFSLNSSLRGKFSKVKHLAKASETCIASSGKFCQDLCSLNSLTENLTIQEKNSQKSGTWKATKKRRNYFYEIVKSNATKEKYLIKEIKIIS